MQATEAIVDCAMGNTATCTLAESSQQLISRNQPKPVAIVPCCVYPELTRRHLADGTEARTYEQFLVYLQHKYGALRRCVLAGMPGRNVVLYRNLEPEAPAGP